MTNHSASPTSVTDVPARDRPTIGRQHGRRRFPRGAGALSAVGAVALVAAACSSSPTSSGSGTTQPTGSASNTGSGSSTPVVKTAHSASFGTILVNSSGMALYTLNPGQTCTGTCAQAWPPLTVATGTTPTAGPGVTGTLATQQTNGALVVTYNGAALYTFTSDSSPGQVTGNGVAGFSVAKVSAGSGGGAGSATTTTSGRSGY